MNIENTSTTGIKSITSTTGFLFIARGTLDTLTTLDTLIFWKAVKS